jgi:hypothetical protein
MCRRSGEPAPARRLAIAPTGAGSATPALADKKSTPGCRRARTTDGAGAVTGRGVVSRIYRLPSTPIVAPHSPPGQGPGTGRRPATRTRSSVPRGGAASWGRLYPAAVAKYWNDRPQTVACQHLVPANHFATRGPNRGKLLSTRTVWHTRLPCPAPVNLMESALGVPMPWCRRTAAVRMTSAGRGHRGKIPPPRQRNGRPPVYTR